MVKSENKIVSSSAELDSIFEHDATRKSIADKLVMPRPASDGKIITILHSKGDDGSLGLVKIVNNPKFRDGNGIFMTVEEYDHPGVELQMGLGKSLKQSLDRMCNTEGFPLDQLPGKIVHITANYYTTENAPKCSKCNGRGCEACESTGYSTVFNVRLRKDLMNPTKVAKSAGVF